MGVLCVLGASFVTPACAGMFSITPVRVYMAPRDRATAITVTNEGDEQLVMQADLYQWKQKPGGEEDLVLTEDLFLSPPIIKLAANSRQVVRLAMMHPPLQGRELTYRMIVREIPEARPPKEGAVVQIALAFSIPVFITPPGAKAKLDCIVERSSANTVKAVCENSGAAHTHPVALVLTNSSGERIASEDSGAYILPDIKRSFDLTRKDGKIPAGKAKLNVSFADGTAQSYDVSIAE
ncbi:MAG: fimbria/pilus periplasmic chaperone [Sulfuritalea sp.]|nr:fimbria/pilus periplasmic chaperone [Sulfuritalea sp.]